MNFVRGCYYSVEVGDSFISNGYTLVGLHYRHDQVKDPLNTFGLMSELDHFVILTCSEEELHKAGFARTVLVLDGESYPCATFTNLHQRNNLTVKLLGQYDLPVYMPFPYRTKSYEKALIGTLELTPDGYVT